MDWDEMSSSGKDGPKHVKTNLTDAAKSGGKTIYDDRI